MKKLLSLIGIGVFIVLGCSKDDSVESRIHFNRYILKTQTSFINPTPDVPFCGEAYSADLIRKNGQVCGELLVFNDYDSLYIILSTEKFREFDKVKVFTGEFTNLPLDAQNSSLIPDRFNRQMKFDAGKSYVRFGYPLFAGLEEVVVSLEAELRLMGIEDNIVMTESVWADGIKLSGEITSGAFFRYEVQDGLTNSTIASIL